MSEFFLIMLVTVWVGGCQTLNPPGCTLTTSSGGLLYVCSGKLLHKQVQTVQMQVYE
jgi:hypothetical protein